MDNVENMSAMDIMKGLIEAKDLIDEAKEKNEPVHFEVGDVSGVKSFLVDEIYFGMTKVKNLFIEVETPDIFYKKDENTFVSFDENGPQEVEANKVYNLVLVKDYVGEDFSKYIKEATIKETGQKLIIICEDDNMNYFEKYNEEYAGK